MIPNRIRIFILRAVTLLFAASFLTAGVSAQVKIATAPNRITEKINNNYRVTLHGMVNPLATAANDRGPAPASMAVNKMHLVLKRTAAQQAALKQLIREQNTPGSPEYHKWLTPAEFGKQFGPSSEDLQKIESWLSAEGFNGIKVNAGRQTIAFNGTVEQVQHTFHADFHRYEIRGATHYAVANNPQIPAALAPVVQGFVSLNNFPVHRYTHVLGKAKYNPKTHMAKPQWTYPVSGNGEMFVLSPQDFGVEYDLPNTALNSSYSGTNYNGAGESIAIINDANINVNLVNDYRKLFGLPANPPHVIIVGNDPGIDGINDPGGPNYDSIESYLDVEEAGSVAPDATIDLVIAADTASEPGLILAAEHAVYSDVAPVISISFGSCEANLGASNAFVDQLWQQAAAEGITVVASAGDAGSAGCDSSNSQFATGGLGVNGFASTPYDVAVGGTDFYYSSWNQGSTAIDSQLGTYWNTNTSTTPQASIKGYIPEQPWNDSQYGDNLFDIYTNNQTTTIAAGGGGASSCIKGTSTSSSGSYTSCTGGYAKPAWQTGLGTSSRDIPDVSLFAADGVNYSYYPICAEDGDCQAASSGTAVQITGVGGTSASAPAFAGIMALVDQATGHRQGQADNVLYPLAAQYPAAFHPITNGTNSVPCNIDTITSGSTSYPPADCIAVSNPATVTTSSGTSVTEGQIGTGTTPDYVAKAGYNMATGLGSVNVATMIADWNKVTFTPTTVTLTSPTAGTTITHGQSMTFSGSVTGSSGTPTGDVAIETNSSVSGTQGEDTLTLDSSGGFSGSINYLPGGTYNVWARYAGDTKNASSESSPVQITVNPENSTLLFQAFDYNSSGKSQNLSGQSIPYGTQVFVDATPYGTNFYNTCVAPSSPPSSCSTNLQTAATGTVSFKDGSTTLKTAVIDSEGTAEYVTPALTVGSHSLTASYSGDASYNASTGSAINITVTKATPTILVTAPTTNANQGQNYILTVEVVSNGIGVAPTGTVTVSGLPSGSTASAKLGSLADPTYGNTAAVANVVIPGSTATGTYNLTIKYSGDGNYNSGQAATYSFTEGAAAKGSASSITAKASAISSTPTTPITVTATVTGQTGGPAPTGTVYFLAGQLNLSSSASSQLQDNALFEGSLTKGSGIASTLTGTINSSDMLQGDNYLTVYYGGDSNYAPSSTVLNLSNPLSDFSMVAQMPMVPISPSGSVTDTVNLTSVNGFNGTVALSCTAPNGLSCSVNPTSASLTSSTSVTTGPISQVDQLVIFGSGGGLALGFLMLMGIPARKRSWRNMLGLVLLFAICGFGLLGCGGGSKTSSGGGNLGGGGTSVSSSSSGGTSTSNGPNVTVPVKVTITGNGSISPGSYQVVVTGDSSSTSQSHTITITTVVQ